MPQNIAKILRKMMYFARKIQHGKGQIPLPAPFSAVKNQQKAAAVSRGAPFALEQGA